eukprot:tig00000194_g14821.t1
MYACMCADYKKEAFYIDLENGQLAPELEGLSDPKELRDAVRHFLTQRGALPASPQPFKVNQAGVMIKETLQLPTSTSTEY